MSAMDGSEEGLPRQLLDALNGREEADSAAEKLASLTRLAGGIAHDFNNLLGILQGNMEMIALCTPPESEISRNIETMRKAFVRAQGLVQRLGTIAGGGEPVGERAPLAEAAAQQAAITPEGCRATGRSSPAGGVPMRRTRILVMDDEEMLLTFVRSALTRAGFEVEIAGEGTTAIKRYREAMDRNEPFTLVILDLAVRGGMGGLATLGRLREIDAAVRAVASSGAPDDPVMNDFMEFGFVERLIKPYSIDKLRETLHRVLGA